MFFVWALALSGFFLIYMEFFLPGAIMAIGGSILLLGSVFMFYLANPSLLLLVSYLIVLAAAVFTVVRFAQWRVRFVARKDRLVSPQPIPLLPKEMLGKMATASTDLKPSGQISINDELYHALAEGGHIGKGTHVIVIGNEGVHLIVQSHERGND